MCPVVKKKKERKAIPVKYVLLIFTILCALLIFVTFRSENGGVFIGNAAGRLIIPFQKGIASFADRLVTMSDEKRTIKELREENESLKAQIDELEIENALLQQERYELNSLRELYALDQQYADYEKVGAHIIASNSSNWFYSFLIDKGENDGIQVGMNVIAGSGLVGIVSQVGSDYARVESIISDGTNVSAEVLHTQDHLIVSGNMELIEQGMISFSQLIDSDDEVQRGDKIVTSNISDRYLPGLLIGYVTAVEPDSNQLTKSGHISPVVDFEHLSEVLIITQTKETAEAADAE